MYCMGAYAQLTVGPNAGNLFGARIAAAQISAALAEDALLADVHHSSSPRYGWGTPTSAASLNDKASTRRGHRGDQMEPARAAYTGAGGNMFSALALDSTSSDSN